MLDDQNPHQRAQGIHAGLAGGKHAAATVVYTNYGISDGMIKGIQHAQNAGRTIEFRAIGENDESVSVSS
ncbi:hypothetical protein D3C74_476720 [compost metagenome]